MSPALLPQRVECWETLGPGVSVQGTLRTSGTPASQKCFRETPGVWQAGPGVAAASWEVPEPRLARQNCLRGGVPAKQTVSENVVECLTLAWFVSSHVPFSCLGKPSGHFLMCSSGGWSHVNSKVVAQNFPAQPHLGSAVVVFARSCRSETPEAFKHVPGPFPKLVK